LRETCPAAYRAVYRTSDKTVGPHERSKMLRILQVDLENIAYRGI